MTDTARKNQTRKIEKVLAKYCDPAGLNFRGVVSVAASDDEVPDNQKIAPLLKGAKSAIVIGNAGRNFWNAYTVFLEANPDYPKDSARALDNYTADAVRKVSKDLDENGISNRLIFYWEQVDGRFVPLMRLAEQAGMGKPGKIGVMIHPEYGPWLAYRAVILTTVELEPTAPLIDFNPCDDCEAPCVPACTGESMSDTGWDMNKCTMAKVVNKDCAKACAARWECVLGQNYRYPPEEIAYHSGFAHRAISMYMKSAR